jgi:uncharacterized protein YciI
MNRLLLGLVPALLAAAEPAIYYVGFLRAGPNAAKFSTEELKQLQQNHMNHIRSMAESGALVGAGPAIGSPTLRGLFIFKTDSIAKARELAEADPAVKAGRMMVQVYEWRGPAGLSDEYRARKKADPKAQDKMLTTQLVIFKHGNTTGAEGRPNAVLSRALAFGPFIGDSELRGMAVLTLANVEEAKKLVESDPAVASGAVRAEVHPWMVADGVFPQR